MGEVGFGSRLCKNVCCYFCVARLWVWMISRDVFSGIMDFRRSCGLFGRLAPL